MHVLSRNILRVSWPEKHFDRKLSLSLLLKCSSVISQRPLSYLSIVRKPRIMRINPFIGWQSHVYTAHSIQAGEVSPSSGHRFPPSELCPGINTTCRHGINSRKPQADILFRLLFGNLALEYFKHTRVLSGHTHVTCVNAEHNLSLFETSFPVSQCSSSPDAMFGWWWNV